MDTNSDLHSPASAEIRCTSQASFWTPTHLLASAWHEHSPFAFWLTQAIQPRCFVELGTHNGFSYLSFSQAVRQLALHTTCYAIDTWIGDEHAGFYGEEVFSTLTTINDRNYRTFSHLIRSRFDDALPHFPDGSIDLLHIDGRHRYEDVRHDFETWRPKLSRCAVVLFHDTNERERGFGVWRLWQELVAEHPSFEFHHGHGLGVLAPCQLIPDGLKSLFESDPLQQVGIRNAYARLGSAVDAQYELHIVRARSTGVEEELRTAAVAATEDATAARAETTAAQTQATAAEATAMAARAGAAAAEAAATAARAEATAATAAATAARAEAVEAARSAAAVASAALAEGARLEAAAAVAERQRDALTTELTWARDYLAAAAAAAAEQARLAAASDAAYAKQSAALVERDAVLNSTIWRATWPVRRAGSALPVTVRRGTRRLLRAGHWALTGQFGRRMAEWRNARNSFMTRADQLGQAEDLSAVVAEAPTEAEYDRWIRLCDTLDEADRFEIGTHIARMALRPLISVVMPAYETPERLLHEAIASVRAQLYSNWELCIADDASPSNSVVEVLEKAAAEDARIRWMRRDRNGNIAAATNSALAMATGEFVVLLDHDDLLSERALYEIAAELNLHPEIDVVYSDEDQLDADGRRLNPYFKPDWNIELMLGHNLISHLGAYRRSLVEQVGGMRLGYEGSQDYDLALRAVAATDHDRIRHIPAILYHWRQHTSSFSKAREAACVDAARLAIRDYLVSQGAAGAEVVPAPAIQTWTRVRWPIPDPAPSVSIIVPTRDLPELLARCTAAVLDRTDYPVFELIIADNDTSDPEACSLLRKLAKDPRVRVLPSPGPFNYAAINNAATQVAIGEVLVLLNNDVDVINGDWLHEMVSLATRPGIGAVGAKLIYANDTIQHAGVVLGVGTFSGGPGVAGHFGLGQSIEDIGYFANLALARECSAVTAACLAVRRSSYLKVGGLDETNLPVAFNDVDFCLRLRDAGLRNLWTPFAELYHLESVSRGNDLDPDKIERFNHAAQYMRNRWGPVLDNDPFYNFNFSRVDHAFRLAFPPRREASRHRRAELGDQHCPPEPKSCSLPYPAAERSSRSIRS